LGVAQQKNFGLFFVTFAIKQLSQFAKQGKFPDVSDEV
jgi:hypothetical protein